MDISATQVYQDHDFMQATQRLLQNTQTDRTEQVGMLIIDSVPYSIFKGVTVVGRHPSCNIVLNDQTVSKRHAEIEAGVKQAWICDLNSSNKTRLNNELLRSSRYYALQDGNTIDFGKIRAIYKIFDGLNESIIPMTPMAPPQKNRHRLVPETPESAEKLKNQSSILEEEISMIPDSQADNEKCTFRRPSIPPERRSTDRLKMYIQDSSLEESMEKSQNSILQESNVSKNKSNISIHDMETQDLIQSNDKSQDFHEMSTQQLIHNTTKKITKDEGEIQSTSYDIHDVETQKFESADTSTSTGKNPKDIHIMKTQRLTTRIKPDTSIANISLRKNEKEIQNTSCDVHDVETQKFEKHESGNSSMTTQKNPKDISDMETQKIHDVETQRLSTSVRTDDEITREITETSMSSISSRKDEEESQNTSYDIHEVETQEYESANNSKTLGNISKDIHDVETQNIYEAETQLMEHKQTDKKAPDIEASVVTNINSVSKSLDKIDTSVCSNKNSKKQATNDNIDNVTELVENNENNKNNEESDEDILRLSSQDFAHDLSELEVSTIGSQDLLQDYVEISSIVPEKSSSKEPNVSSKDLEKSEDFEKNEDTKKTEDEESIFDVPTQVANKNNDQMNSKPNISVVDSDSETDDEEAFRLFKETNEIVCESSVKVRYNQKDRIDEVESDDSITDEEGHFAQFIVNEKNLKCTSVKDNVNETKTNNVNESDNSRDSEDIFDIATQCADSSKEQSMKNVSIANTSKTSSGCPLEENKSKTDSKESEKNLQVNDMDPTQIIEKSNAAPCPLNRQTKNAMEIVETARTQLVSPNPSAENKSSNKEKINDTNSFEKDEDATEIDDLSPSQLIHSVHSSDEEKTNSDEIRASTRIIKKFDTNSFNEDEEDVIEIDDMAPTQIIGKPHSSPCPSNRQTKNAMEIDEIAPTQLISITEAKSPNKPKTNTIEMNDIAPTQILSKADIDPSEKLEEDAIEIDDIAPTQLISRTHSINPSDERTRNSVEIDTSTPSISKSNTDLLNNEEEDIIEIDDMAPTQLITRADIKSSSKQKKNVNKSDDTATAQFISRTVTGTSVENEEDVTELNDTSPARLISQSNILNVLTESHDSDVSIEDAAYEMAPTQVISDAGSTTKKGKTELPNRSTRNKSPNKPEDESGKINLNDTLEENLKNLFVEEDDHSCKDSTVMSTQCLTDVLESTQAEENPDRSEIIERTPRKNRESNRRYLSLSRYSKSPSTPSRRKTASNNVSIECQRQNISDKLASTEKQSKINMDDSLERNLNNIFDGANEKEPTDSSTYLTTQNLEDILEPSQSSMELAISPNKKDRSKKLNKSNVRTKSSAPNNQTSENNKKSNKSNLQESETNSDSQNSDNYFSNITTRRKCNIIKDSQESIDLISYKKSSNSDNKDDAQIPLTTSMEESDDDILANLPPVRILGTASNPASPSASSTSTVRDYTMRTKRETKRKASTSISELSILSNLPNKNKKSRIVRTRNIRTSKYSKSIPADIKSLDIDSDDDIDFEQIKEIADKLLAIESRYDKRSKSFKPILNKNAKKSGADDDADVDADVDAISSLHIPKESRIKKKSIFTDSPKDESTNNHSNSIMKSPVIQTRNRSRRFREQHDESSCIFQVNEATVGDVSDKSSRSKTTKETKETKETRDEKRSLSAIDANIEESIAKRPRREPQTRTYKIKDEHVNDSMNIIRSNESRLKSTRIQNVNTTGKKEIMKNTKLNPSVLTERPFGKTENRNDSNKIEEMPKIENKRKRGKPKKMITNISTTESASITNDKKHVTGENSPENPRIMPNNPSTSSKLLLTIERINRSVEESKTKRPRREMQTRTHKIKDEQDSISTVTSDDSFRSTRSRNTENSEKASTIESTKLNPVVLMKQVQLENKNNSKGVAKIEKKKKRGRSKMVINDNSFVSTESDSLVSDGIRVPSEESQEIRKIMRNVRSTSFKAVDNRKETTLDDKSSISITTPKKTSLSTNSANTSLITSTPRTRSMSLSRSNISSSPSKTKLKIVFTGISSETYSKVFKKFGIVEVMDYAKCDVLVTDKVRRTVKFLCALAQGTPIVSIEWLNDSRTSENLLDWTNYILKDPVAEAKFGFKLRTSLEKAREKKLLDGFTVLLTPNIAQPPIADLKSMIISCGGKPLIRVPPAWRKNTVIISTEDDILSAQRFLSKAPKGIITVQSTEFILTGILRQELDFVKYRLIS